LVPPRPEEFQSPIKRRPLLPEKKKADKALRYAGFNRLSSGVLFYPRHKPSPMATALIAGFQSPINGSSIFHLIKILAAISQPAEFQSPINGSSACHTIYENY